MDEGDACNKCTAENCIPDTDGCDIKLLGTDAKQQACWALYCCVRAKRCTDGTGDAGDPLRCWCGTANSDKCEMGLEAPNGPCAKEYSVAAESTDPAKIFVRFVDPHYAIGGADNLVICRATFCRDVCKLLP